MLIYGYGDLKRLKINGHYEIGVKRFRSAEIAFNKRNTAADKLYDEKLVKYDTQCLIFYPIDV